jgi:hypothetical protein
MTSAASTEFPATARFSRRIDPELKAACISGIKVIIALDSSAANPSRLPCPVSGGTCYDDIRRNYSLEDPDSCVSSTSCVSCSPAWSTDKLRLRLTFRPAGAKAGTSAAALPKGPEVKVGPDDTVITLKGFCADASQQGDACKTTITRAQFEKLAEALQPGMSPAIRRSSQPPIRAC